MNSYILRCCLEQHCHLRLRQPYGFIFESDFKLHLRIRLIHYDLPSFLHIELVFFKVLKFTPAFQRLNV